MISLSPQTQAQFCQLGFKLIELNDLFVVVSKSSGIGFHDESTELESKEQRCLGIFSRVQGALLEQGLIDSKLYPLHRLDKGTSGLIVFGRTKAVAQELGEAFAQGRVAKFYLALSKHKPKKKQGAVKGAMEKARRGAWKLGRGKTNYAVSQFFSTGLGDGLRLFLWRPKSGRTHQLRVAMKSLSSPILGDSLYGCDEVVGHGVQFCLHAFQIEFQLQGEWFRFQISPIQEPRFKQETEPKQDESNFGGWNSLDSQCINDGIRAYGEPHLLEWPKV